MTELEFREVYNTIVACIRTLEKNDYNATVGYMNPHTLHSVRNSAAESMYCMNHTDTICGVEFSGNHDIPKGLMLVFDHRHVGTAQQAFTIGEIGKGMDNDTDNLIKELKALAERWVRGLEFAREHREICSNEAINVGESDLAELREVLKNYE